MRQDGCMHMHCACELRVSLSSDHSPIHIEMEARTYLLTDLQSHPR